MLDLGFMLIDYKVCSLRFSFQGILNKDEVFVNPSVKKIHKLENVLVSRISQCDGLLLCVTKDNSCFVWNPYLGQTRWIHPTINNLRTYNSYALGYDDNKYNRKYKILRVLYDFGKAKDEHSKYQTDVYDLSFNTWRVIDVNPDWEEPFQYTGVSLKGNTYFFGRKEDHLHCFDFTTEKFGPRLRLPFKPSHHNHNTVALSCVRDEKLALLYNQFDTLQRIKIWISTKIEFNEVLWSIVFKVDRNHMPRDLPNYFGGSSFFIDEEKKLAVVLRQRVYQKDDRMACIIGEDRDFKFVNIGEGMKNLWDYSNLVSSSYVPSLVQLKVIQPSRKRKEMEN